MITGHIFVLINSSSAMRVQRWQASSWPLPGMRTKHSPLHSQHVRWGRTAGSGGFAVSGD